MATSGDQLIKTLQTALADVTVAYHQFHGYHWAVTGPLFPQWHDKFAEIYEDIYGSIDPIAENIRKLGGMPVFSIFALSQMSNIDESELDSSEAEDIIPRAVLVNDECLATVKAAFDAAAAADEQGIANFLAERIDAHQKWAWQLGASLP